MRAKYTGILGAFEENNAMWLISCEFNGTRFFINKEGIDTDIRENARMFELVLPAKLEAAKQTREYDNSRMIWQIYRDTDTEFLRPIAADLSPKSKVRDGGEHNGRRKD